jgi:hypothetical protein
MIRNQLHAPNTVHAVIGSGHLAQLLTARSPIRVSIDCIDGVHFSRQPDFSLLRFPSACASLPKSMLSLFSRIASALSANSNVNDQS